jgi:hypothetical protein
VRQTIHALDPDASLHMVATMRQLVSASVAQRRITLLLIAVFAAVALLMVVIGLYDVMAYASPSESGRSAFASRWERKASDAKCQMSDVRCQWKSGGKRSH